jgi:hypothetical protein
VGTSCFRGDWPADLGLVEGAGFRRTLGGRLSLLWSVVVVGMDNACDPRMFTSISCLRPLTTTPPLPLLFFDVRGATGAVSLGAGLEVDLG